MKPSSESLIKLFSYYRDAEIRGCQLLFKMMQRVEDGEAQVLFSRHIDDETRHAWLWTQRIRDEGGLPVPVPDGYQRRLGKALGIPRNIVDLFALTVVVEQRSVKRYTEHAASPICDEKTLAVLDDITKDEKWHISWMEEWLMKLAEQQGTVGEVESTLERYRVTEEEVFDSMRDLEREWFGFSFSEKPTQSQAAAP